MLQVHSVPSLARARALEVSQQQLLAKWQGAFWAMLAMFAFIYGWHHLGGYLRSKNAAPWQTYFISSTVS